MEFFRTLILASIIAISTGLAGCGQTGPLYLPDDPALDTQDKPKQARN